MKDHDTQKAFSIALVAALVSVAAVSVVQAQPTPNATSGTAGRIGKFINTSDLGNSVLFESAGRIGLGTSAPVNTLDVRGSVGIWTSKPYLFFRDTASANLRSYMRASNGGLGLFGEDYVNASNPSAFVQIDRDGRVGFGTSTPQRTLQIGPSSDAMFTIEGSDASPRAGFIRFGDRTGWQLRIGRSRESSGGPLNTGLTGALFTFRDDGAFGPTSYPLLATGVEPLCRTLSNFITRCQASSLRYKTNIEPYLGGLDVIERLHPIAFTRIFNGARDIGLAAEAVERVEPRLTYPNDEGKVEGIRYELLTTVLINAVKEQQQVLEQQQEAIAELKAAVAKLQQIAR
jgi:hypothetical protein